MKFSSILSIAAIAATAAHAREYNFTLYSESECGGTAVEVQGKFPTNSNATACLPIPDVPENFQLGSMKWSSGLGCTLKVGVSDTCEGNWWTDGPLLEGWIWPNADQCLDPWFDNYNTTPDKWPKVKYYKATC
ncbi:hypothetical protein DIS24_g7261 [Lasiodiplodia hormozganensis]|uniref:Uncharacterized protein n=1 Tax=Lasiodiplodia hormozganensis TaxID=869390 RepID=A0AA40CRG6_9PEZI|nr:hypothetical protein DIS24_g7261 [Lasiodiplodia hormozganensis]